MGSGENFRQFPLNSNVTILDKTDKFSDHIKMSMQKREDLHFSKLVINQAENMSSIESNSMDAVVHTFFLCSVDNSDLVINEIYRVLKPGGVVIFMEHSVDNHNLCRKSLQKSIEPLFKDCKYKDIKKILNKGVYDKLTIKEYHVSDILVNIFNPIVYGYGQKL